MTKKIGGIVSQVNAIIRQVSSQYSEYEVRTKISTLQRQISEVEKYKQQIRYSMEKTYEALRDAKTSYLQDEIQAKKIMNSTNIDPTNIPIKMAIRNAKFTNQTIGPPKEGLEYNIIEEQNENEWFSNVLAYMNDIGNISGGAAEGTKDFVKQLEPVIESGFKIIKKGEYYKIIFGSNQVKKMLNFRHKYPIKDLAKSKSLQQALRLDKQLKFAKSAGKLGKISSALAIAGIVLDTSHGLYENIDKGESVAETSADATIDIAVGAGGVGTAILGTKGGTVGGAALGTLICPGPGTLIGGVMGGIAGGVGSGWLYSEVISGECFGLFPEGESVEQWFKDVTTLGYEKIGDGIAYVSDKAVEGAIWVGDKAVEGIELIGDGAQWVSDQIGDAIDGIGDFVGNLSFGW